MDKIAKQVAKKDEEDKMTAAAAAISCRSKGRPGRILQFCLVRLVLEGAAVFTLLIP